LQRTILIPMSSKSPVVRLLTVAWLPTGRKTGVVTIPCSVDISPSLALDPLREFVNLNIRHHDASEVRPHNNHTSTAITVNIMPR